MTGIKFIKTRTDLTASERAYLYMINSIKMVVVKLKQ
jgi:hypothetical protein